MQVDVVLSVRVEEEMKIRIEAVGDVTVVFIDGNVLQENVPIFRVKLLELVEEGKVNVVLDMVASNYISSMCLANDCGCQEKGERTRGRPETRTGQ